MRQVVLLSSLDLFLPYDQDMAVSENWRPRPSDRPETLGPHLGEFVAKEFIHRQALNIIILRLGHLVDADEAAQRPFDPMWLAFTDATRAVAAALENEPRSGLLHLQSQSPRARFSCKKAQNVLNFDPVHNFEDIQ